MGFMKKKKKKHISRLKKKKNTRDPEMSPLSFSGHLGFQFYLGPCVWAPGSCKDHVALPLQPQLQTHKRTNPFKDGLLTGPIFPKTDVPSPLTWLSNDLKEQQGRLRQHLVSLTLHLFLIH